MARLIYSSDWPQNKEFLISITSPWDRFNYLKRAITKLDRNYLYSLQHKLFLKTLYWLIIREYLLEIREHKCQRCGKEKRLNVHHESYDHKGSEFENLDDLIVLCRPCHEAESQKIPDIDKVFSIIAAKMKVEPLWRGKKNPDYNPDIVNRIKKEDRFIPKKIGNQLWPERE